MYIIYIYIYTYVRTYIHTYIHYTYVLIIYIQFIYIYYSYVYRNVWYVWVYSTYFWKVKKSGAGMVLMLVTNLPASPSDPIFVEHVWYFRSSWKRRTPKSDCKRMMLNSSCLPFPCSISIWACLKPAIPMDYIFSWSSINLWLWGYYHVLPIVNPFRKAVQRAQVCSLRFAAPPIVSPQSCRCLQYSRPRVVSSQAAGLRHPLKSHLGLGFWLFGNLQKRKATPKRIEKTIILV